MLLSINRNEGLLSFGIFSVAVDTRVTRGHHMPSGVYESRTMYGGYNILQVSFFRGSCLANIFVPVVVEGQQKPTPSQIARDPRILFTIAPR